MKSQDFGMRLLTWCIMLIMLLSAGMAYQRYETSLFPVITEFEVESVTPIKDGVMIQGVMEKNRQCEYVELGAYLFMDGDIYGVPVNVDFLSSEPIYTRSPLTQRWGPWRVDIPYEFESARVEIWVVHQCNLLFQTHSKLTDFTISNGTNMVTVPEGL